MSTFDLAVLDIDGTLLDSTYHHTLAWDRAFRAAGIEVPLWSIHRHIGMGGDRLVPGVAGDEAEESHGELIRSRWEEEYDGLIDQTRLLPGARELLQVLAARGMSVVLASSSIPRHAQHALDLLDADRYAEVTTTAEDAEESKPHPELVQKAADAARGGHGFMVGDAVWDVSAALDAGLPIVGLRCGGYSTAELAAAGAVVVYDDPADLVANLDVALAALAGSRSH